MARISPFLTSAFPFWSLSSLSVGQTAQITSHRKGERKSTFSVSQMQVQRGPSLAPWSDLTRLEGQENAVLELELIKTTLWSIPDKLTASTSEVLLRKTMEELTRMEQPSC